MTTIARITLLSMVLGLSACVVQPQQPERLPPIPPSQPRPTPSPTPDPTPDPTAAPEPTSAPVGHTPDPTDTPSPTATPKPTPTPSSGSIVLSRNLYRSSAMVRQYTSYWCVPATVQSMVGDGSPT